MNETHIIIFGSFCYCSVSRGLLLQKNQIIELLKYLTWIYRVWASYRISCHKTWEFLRTIKVRFATIDFAISSINAHSFDFISFCFQLIWRRCGCVSARMLMISYYTYIIPLLSKKFLANNEIVETCLVHFCVCKCVCLCVFIYTIF